MRNHQSSLSSISNMSEEGGGDPRCEGDKELSQRATIERTFSA